MTDVCVCAWGSEEESLTDVEGDPNFVTAFRPDFRWWLRPREIRMRYLCGQQVVVGACTQRLLIVQARGGGVEPFLVPQFVHVPRSVVISPGSSTAIPRACVVAADTVEVVDGCGDPRKIMSMGRRSGTRGKQRNGRGCAMWVEKTMR